MIRYWARIDRRTLGPYFPGALRRLPGFTKETLVCVSGTTEWVPAESVEEIKETIERAEEQKKEGGAKKLSKEEKRQKRREEKEAAKNPPTPPEEDSAEVSPKKKALLAAAAVLVLAGGGFGAWKMMKSPKEPEVSKAKKVPEVFPDRKQHWAWMALGKPETDLAEGAESVLPDASERFTEGGELSDWKDYERLLVIDGDEERTVYGVNGGKVVAVGRDFKAPLGALPTLKEALPASFGNERNMQPDGEQWKIKWSAPGESWRAVLEQDPTDEAALADRVRSLRLIAS